MKFDATTFNVEFRGVNLDITIGFDLVDETVIDPVTGKPTIRASTTTNFNVNKNQTAAQIKTQIALACKSVLQEYYDNWKAKTAKIVEVLSSNEAALETYLNANITF
jgi:hypothetical protein